MLDVTFTATHMAGPNPLEPHHLEQKLDVSVSGNKALHLSFREPEVVSSIWQRPHILSDQWVVVLGLLVKAHVSKNIVSVNHWPLMFKRKVTVIILYLIYSKFSISLHYIIFLLAYIYHWFDILCSECYQYLGNVSSIHYCRDNSSGSWLSPTHIATLAAGPWALATMASWGLQSSRCLLQPQKLLQEPRAFLSSSQSSPQHCCRHWLSPSPQQTCTSLQISFSLGFPWGHFQLSLPLLPPVGWHFTSQSLHLEVHNYLLRAH